MIDSFLEFEIVLQYLLVVCNFLLCLTFSCPFPMVVQTVDVWYRSAPKHMGTSSFLWNCTKKFITAGIVTVTVTDHFVTVIPVRGGSMSPTFNPKAGSHMGDFKIVDFVVWPLIILQMTMFWLRNFALGITSFHMAMWWSFGNIFVHPLPSIVLFTLRIKFAFICHIFLFYMMSGR